VFLDAGLVIEMDEAGHKNLFQVLNAFTQKDGYKAGQLVVEGAVARAAKSKAAVALGTTSLRDEIGSPIDIEKFCNGVDTVFRKAKASERLTVELGAYISQLFTLACDHSVRLDPQFASVAVAMRVMEGIANRLNPDVDLVSVAGPMFLQGKWSSVTRPTDRIEK